MQQQNRVGIGGSVLDPGHPDTAAVAVVELAIMRHIREIGDLGKSLIGSS